MNVKVTDRDKGAKTLMAKLAKLRAGTISVGIHAGEGSAPAQVWEGEPSPGLTVAELAEKHEFGLGVPPRSFIRGPFDEHKLDFTAEFRVAVKNGLLDRFTPEQALARFGLRVVGLLQETMATGGNYPGLASFTERKREEMGMTPPFVPLIVTGQIRSSIRCMVNDKYIGADGNVVKRPARKRKRTLKQQIKSLKKGLKGIKKELKADTKLINRGLKRDLRAGKKQVKQAVRSGKKTAKQTVRRVRKALKGSPRRRK